MDRGAPILPGELVEEALGQGGDVAGPLAQGREVDGEHAEPVEEVLAEPPLGHSPAQVRVGGGHEAHIHLPGLLGAEGIDLLLLDGPQQLGLEVQGQVADLVQEEGAAVRQLEPAFTGRCRAAEGALHVAEEL